jgi:hypothetical protein
MEEREEVMARFGVAALLFRVYSASMLDEYARVVILRPNGSATEVATVLYRTGDGVLRLVETREPLLERLREKE